MLRNRKLCCKDERSKVNARAAALWKCGRANTNVVHVTVTKYKSELPICLRSARAEYIEIEWEKKSNEKLLSCIILLNIDKCRNFKMKKM